MPSDSALPVMGKTMSDDVTNDDAQPTEDDAPKAKDGLEADLHAARTKKNEAIARAEAAEKELKKLQRANLSEMEKLRAEFDDAKAAIDALAKENGNLKSANVKAQIANEFGLNPKYAKRLSGSTEEELRADAAELKELQGDSTPDEKSKGTTRTVSGSAEKTRTSKPQGSGSSFNDKIRSAYRATLSSEKEIDF